MSPTSSLDSARSVNGNVKPMIAGSMPPELEGRVSSLDGLRAVSILMVIYSHASFSCNFFSLPEPFHWIINGELGVRVFFVISGFIITLLLLKEERVRGEFSIRHFYLRRVLRIIPVYYAFLAVMLVIVNIWDLTVNRHEFAAAFTFTTGWWEGSTWLLGHTWSLSVEEQFYLLWPLCLFLVRERRNRILVSIVLLAIYPLMRVLVYLSSLSELRPYLFITRGDSIIAGCLLALLLFYHGEDARKYFSKYVLPLRLILLAIIAALTAVQSKAMLGWLTVPFANSVESISIAWLIASCILNKDAVHHTLNARIPVFLGWVSYSWYLWQQLFLTPCHRFFDSAWSGFPLNVAASLAAATASYFIIEKSFEKLKNKLLKN